MNDTILDNNTNGKKIERSIWRTVFLWLIAIGPGLTVMLADTDAGSVITAAQSGVQWKYSLVLAQVVLIPFLYVVQEITVRLGIVTKKGHGELILLHFGRWWASLSAITLLISVIGALVTEYAAFTGVGALLGIPPSIVVPVLFAVLMGIFLSGSYLRVERIAIFVGLFEIFFIVAAFLIRPDFHRMAHGLLYQPIDKPDYRFLLAANVGAVIMPWMIFYQQSAVVEKKLLKNTLRTARFDTILGAVLTQIIMIAVVITAAAVSKPNGSDVSINTSGDLITALTPVLGSAGALLVIGFGMLGAGLVAAIVVSAAAAWTMGEVFGFKCSFDAKLKEAKFYYAIFFVINLIAGGIVLMGVNLTAITLDVEVMNALLLPLVLGLLLAIEQKALPLEYRLKGVHMITVWVLSGVVIAFGLYMGWDVLHHFFIKG